MQSTDSALDDAAQNPLWLELRSKGTVRVFPFLKERTRPIAVGSVCHADLCVRHPGVCPIHFEFEREQDAILLVLAPGVDVRVNAAHAADRSGIGERARIEFSGMFIEAVVHKRCPFLDLESAVQVLTGSEAEIESQFFLFDEAEPTRATIPAAERTLAQIGAQPIDRLMCSRSVGAAISTIPTLSSIEPNDLDRAFDAVILPDPGAVKAEADAGVTTLRLRRARRGERPSLLAALGLFAMKHPILAAGSSLLVGLMLALAAIGVLRAVHAVASMRGGGPRGLAPRSEAAAPRFSGYVEREAWKATSARCISSAV